MSLAADPSTSGNRALRVGVDVGGTNTDAVLMDGRRVVAKTKSATTADVSGGIVDALSTLLSVDGVIPGDVAAVMIGTTHFTNAFIEGRHLSPVAAIRLGLPATKSVPPFIDWPAPARAAVGGAYFLCHGGHEIDGRPIAPVDREELLRVAAEIGRRELRSVAISAVFSPVNPEAELAAARILRAELGDIPISLSHEIGRVGMLARENATIINACLRELAARTVRAFRDSVKELGISAPIYLSQNDGTLGGLEFTERYPVKTFTAGPTNSMRGAAFLSGELDCAVVDIGGTTADIGMLQHGFPRESSTDADVGGVRTNFRLPDVVSIGLGGGSLVDLATTRVGPRSVGYELTRRALVFGGDTLTATDLAVAAGRAALGDPTRVAGLDPRAVRECLELIEADIAEAVDRMRTGPEPLPVVLVGGGSLLLGEALPGAAALIRPEHFEVANAVGAAIAQVGAVAERMYSATGASRGAALAEATEEATRAAVAAGADASTVHVVDVEEISVAYVPGNATRVRVKAVGDLPLENQHALHY